MIFSTTTVFLPLSLIFSSQTASTKLAKVYEVKAL